MNKILITITTLILTFSSLQAVAVEGSSTYVNPMPNLARYAMGNAELLGLTQKQMHSLKEWASVNKPKVKQLVRELSLQENKLLKEALSNDVEVVQKAEESLEVRKEIMEIKTHCRTHLKEVLTPTQYTKVIDLYKDEQYRKSQLIL